MTRTPPTTAWIRPRYERVKQLQDVSGNNIQDVSGRNLLVNVTGGDLVPIISTNRI